MKTPRKPNEADRALIKSGQQQILNFTACILPEKPHLQPDALFGAAMWGVLSTFGSVGLATQFLRETADELDAAEARATGSMQ